MLHEVLIRSTLLPNRDQRGRLPVNLRQILAESFRGNEIESNELQSEQLFQVQRRLAFHPRALHFDQTAEEQETRESFVFVHRKCEYRPYQEPYTRGFRRLVNRRADTNCEPRGWKACVRNQPEYQTVYKTFYRTVYKCADSKHCK